MPISRSQGVVVSAALMALAAGYFALQDSAHHDRSSPHQAHAGMPTHSASATAEPGAGGTSSSVKAEDGRTIRIAIAPGSDAPPGVYRFRKNDSVDFRITVPYDGMLAVHGYTQDVSVAANSEITLPLKLEHTGRFPMHVHANGGRHIEVAVLEILPD